MFGVFHTAYSKVNSLISWLLVQADVFPWQREVFILMQDLSASPSRPTGAEPALTLRWITAKPILELNGRWPLYLPLSNLTVKALEDWARALLSAAKNKPEVHKKPLLWHWGKALSLICLWHKSLLRSSFTPVHVHLHPPLTVSYISNLSVGFPTF